MRPRRSTNLSVSTLSSLSSPIEPSTSQSPIKERFLWAPLPDANAALPSPLIKHARETKSPVLGRLHSRVNVKHVLVITALVGLYLLYSCLELNRYLPFGSSVLSVSGERFELLEGARLPDQPSSVLIRDERGRQRWTMSIPKTTTFPLRPDQYRDLCSSSEDVSRIAHASSPSSRITGKAGLLKQRRSYYDVDRGFVDVADAERIGMLPPSTLDAPGVSPAVGRDNSSDVATCDRSLTFVMETAEAGFGSTLLALWLSYGLAKKEGRSFFIDDTRWSYGSYTSYFVAPPVPSCSRPPPSHMLPCPHQANHLVVSAATVPWTFGDEFRSFFGETRRSPSKGQRQIFGMLRTGYEDLFHLIGEDATFLKQKASEIEHGTHPVVGIHIRRGDRHPFELEFSKDYLPSERFISAAQHLFSVADVPSGQNASSAPSLFLASDDPDMVTSRDILSTVPSDVPLTRVQNRIVLASKRTLEPAVPLREPGSAYTKHVDENSGWEGGFYAALFNSLGRPRGSAGASAEVLAQMDAQATGLRTLLGRAYLLDLAVLAETDGIVCAVSSAACRVLGVIKGWDAVSTGTWINVDDGRGWSWDGKN